jgi:aspartokinase/homoserine dehydrogenase 1
LDLKNPTAVFFALRSGLSSSKSAHQTQLSDALRRVIDIVLSPTLVDGQPARQVVVVSAFHGVTNQICGLAARAARGDEEISAALDELEQRHQLAVNDLISVTQRSAVTAQPKVWCNELRELLHGISLVREASRKTLDAAMSYGERLSARRSSKFGPMSMGSSPRFPVR